MITINECIYKILHNLIKCNINYKSGRPLTYDITHYIDVIFKVLCTGCQWNSLKEKLHYTVYHKHFIKWINLGIFFELNNIVTLMISKLNNINSDAYIDTAIIRNIGGIEDISYNHKIKSKKGTKVSIIVNAKGMPLSIHIVNSNHHDVSLVLPNLFKINKGTKIDNLIGDRGYVSTKIKNYLKDKHDIKYMYPDKKNTLNPMSAEDKLKIKSRSINENSFSWMTQYRRLTSRFEKYTKTFTSFIYLAFCNITLNKLNKMNNVNGNNIN
jgi:putative transposase